MAWNDHNLASSSVYLVPLCGLFSVSFWGGGSVGGVRAGGRSVGEPV